MNIAGFVENQSISEERQAIEEAIEENEEERIPHELFYSGILEESFLPEKSNNINSQFASSLASPTKMGVIPSELVNYSLHPNISEFNTIVNNIRYRRHFPIFELNMIESYQYFDYRYDTMTSHIKNELKNTCMHI